VIAFDEAHGQVVLFGGTDGASPTPTFYQDTWLFDGTAWTAVTPTVKPAVRAYASIAFDHASGQVVLVGGETATALYNDTYVWDGVNWTAKPATAGLSKRALASLASDPVRGQLVLFGGVGRTTSASVWFNDTWVWTNGAWVQRTPFNPPPPRSAAGFAYDPAQQRLVLFGGEDLPGSQLDDAWTWNGTDWDLLPFAGLVDPIEGLSFVTSPYGAGVIAYGGLSAGAYSNDHLQLRLSADETFERCGRNDTDGDGLIGCADPDCWPTCTPACPPGLSCAQADHVCGNGTCDAAESCASCPADCGACPTLCGDDRCDPGETCPGDCP
jgi:hypothetical protein